MIRGDREDFVSHLSGTVSWFDDTPYSAASAEAAGYLLNFWRRDAVFGSRVAAFGWISDQVDQEELHMLDALGRIASKNVEMATAATKFPWVLDGVAVHEPELMHALDRLTHNDIQLARKLASLPMYADEEASVLDSYVMSALIRFAEIGADTFETIVSQPWFLDGLDDDEAAAVVVLGTDPEDIGSTSGDLLNSPHTESKTVSLPMAGDVNIRVISGAPLSPDDDTLSLIEDAAREIEAFLDTPFPTDEVIALVKDLRTDEGNVFHLGEFVGQHYGTHIRINRVDRQSDLDFRSIISHEMTHYYTFNPHWFNESVAELAAAYVNDRLGLQSVSARSESAAADVQSDCAEGEGLENIRHSLYRDPLRYYYGISACTYLMGENLLLQTYLTIGEEAVSSALRDLYALRGEIDREVAGARMYETLLKHTPQDRRQEFRDVFRRLYGGSFEDSDAARADDHADELSGATAIEAGQTVEGALDYSFDFDYFLLRARAGRKYEFDLAHPTLPPSSILTYEPDGEWAPWKSRARVPTGLRMQWVAPGDGPYYFAVHNFAGETGRYTLTATRVEDKPDDHGDSAADATEVAVGANAEMCVAFPHMCEGADGVIFGGMSSGVIDDDFDVDFFKFHAVKGRQYTATIVDAPREYLYHMDLYFPDYVAEGGGGVTWRAQISEVQYIYVHSGPGIGSKYTLVIKSDRQ